MLEYTFEYQLAEGDVVKFYRSEVDPETFIEVFEEYENGFTQASNVFEHVESKLSGLQEVTEADIDDRADTYFPICVGGNG